MAKGLTSILVDTDLFIDYLNGVVFAKTILDSPRYRCYYAAITQKELLAMPGLSMAEYTKILRLLSKHRSVSVNDKIAHHFSSLMVRYSKQGLRNADALVAATAIATRFPLLTRNLKHYRFISEIKLIQPDDLI